MRRWQWATAGGLVGLTIVGGATSTRIADVTMTDHYASRVAYACSKVHLLATPYRDCTVNWIEALRYEIRRIRHRLPNPGPPCGDAQTVYVAAVHTDFWGLGPGKTPRGEGVVMWDSTQASFVHRKPPMDRADLFESLQGLRDETLTDYYTRNVHAVALGSLDSLPNVAVLSPARADSITRLARRGGDLYGFLYSHYPRAAGMVGMSRPGLSADRRQALLELQWTKGPLNGMGTLLLLKCRGKEWTLSDWLQTWVS